MSTAELSLDELDVCTPELYATRGYPHEEWTRLRRESPVHWFAPKEYRPFWAITKHEDVKHISTRPEQFVSGPRMALAPRRLEDAFGRSAGRGMFPRALVNMDPPEHHDYRELAAPFFKASVMRNLEERMVETARILLDEVGKQKEIDFVTDVATWHPLRMLCEILGVAQSDELVLAKLARALFGGLDPEYADLLAFVPEAARYLQGVIADRRAQPRDDLASVLANARLNGEPVSDLDTLSYFIMIATAGHDTTHFALAGGMLALVEHPAELAKLQRDPSLIRTAADEMVRWTSPVVHFIRTAVKDCEIRGQHIRAGDSLVLFYPSANRDEEVFDDPFVFRIDRDPNPHLGFGVGEHFCLGAALARLTIRALLREMIPRLEYVELAGEPAHSVANFVSGVKHLPIRWRVVPSGS